MPPVIWKALSSGGPGRGSRLTAARADRVPLRKALKRGTVMLALLTLLNAVVVPVAVWAHPFYSPPVGHLPVPPVPWSNLTYAEEQVAIHLVAGFFVGVLAGGISKGAIGAALGMFIDVDHLSAFFGANYAVRYGHSLFLLGGLILLVWAFRVWPWGARDFALFSTAQFMAHFAVAPPGFPLLSPLLVTSFHLSSWVFGLGAGLCVAAGWVWGDRSLLRAAGLVRHPSVVEHPGGSRPVPAEGTAALSSISSG